MMAGSSLRRVKMDDYNTKVRPYNQLDKASHIERGPLPPLLLTVSQRGSHRYSQFHGWPSPFKNVPVEPQFSPPAGESNACRLLVHKSHISGLNLHLLISIPRSPSLNHFGTTAA